MNSAGSVTTWIGRLKAGDHAAAQRLWEGYFRRLVGLARARLQGTPRAAADEEDVALSAFDSFCRGAERGQFPQLVDRHDLWQLLVLLTARKAVQWQRHERRQKRGGGRVLGEADLGDANASGDEPALAQVLGPEPTPEFAAQVAEECQRLLGLLDDGRLRALALRKMEGYTNEEIARDLGCGLRSVERKLVRIRTLWASEVGP
jgi:DNA-directed RNA polymerase specialized sigma24 family protein